MGGEAFREDVAGFVGPSVFVPDDPVTNIGHIDSPVGPMRVNNIRGEAGPELGAGALWAPGKHFVATLIQDAQGIRLLRHVQRLKEGLGSHFCVLQVGCVMFNPVQSGMSFVGATHPKELDNKRRKSSVLLEERPRAQRYGRLAI
jgi:hypothetical protein